VKRPNFGFEEKGESILHCCDNRTAVPWSDVMLCADNGKLSTRTEFFYTDVEMV
jgi:hypothetical protein